MIQAGFFPSELRSRRRRRNVTKETTPNGHGTPTFLSWPPRRDRVDRKDGTEIQRNTHANGIQLLPMLLPLRYCALPLLPALSPSCCSTLRVHRVGATRILFTRTCSADQQYCLHAPFLFLREQRQENLQWLFRERANIQGAIFHMFCTVCKSNSGNIKAMF